MAEQLALPGMADPLAGLSDAAQGILIVMGRYEADIEGLKHDAPVVTKGTDWEVKGEEVEGAVAELVEAGVVTIDGEVIRRIQYASD